MSMAAAGPDAAVEAQAQALEAQLWAEPMDVAMLDKLIATNSNPKSPGYVAFQRFFEHPNAWTRVDAIVENSALPHTKILALASLSQMIRTRWATVDPAEREGIKNFVVGYILKISSDAKAMAQQHAFLGKLNEVLIQVVKNEWPHNWPTFIEDIVNASKNSQSVCSNNMAILLLLSEDVFEYSRGQLTTGKTARLKTQFHRDFSLIYELCEYVLNHSENAVLLNKTLDTLQRFLRWIPKNFIFETKLVEVLATRFFPEPYFQVRALNCLTEIGGFSIPDKPDYDECFVAIFTSVMERVSQVLDPALDLEEAFKSQDTELVAFLRALTNFIADFLKAHLTLLEQHSDQTRGALLMSLNLLLRLSMCREAETDGDEVVVFDVCLEFWIEFLKDVYLSERAELEAFHEQQHAANEHALILGNSLQRAAAAAAASALDAQPEPTARLQLYRAVLIDLRQVLILCMARPEEVLVVQNDDSGEVEQARVDHDSLRLYGNIRDALIYLTNLDANATTRVMSDRLDALVADPEWNPHMLNKICWAIGSISRALTEAQEKAFLVSVVKALLSLVEKKTQKHQKAIIAANIMYVVGQYPNFLRKHWNFLETVVRKLFEFMEEKHPGVRDMSVNTFLKIATKCRKTFVVASGSREPYINVIINDLPRAINDLENPQLYVFYEAVGHIVAAEQNPEVRQSLLARLMVLPNQFWTQIVAEANANLESLWQPATLDMLEPILRTNTRVCSALKGGFLGQLSRIFLEMLYIYRIFSSTISRRIQTEQIANPQMHGEIRRLRVVKMEILRLISTYVDGANRADADVVLNEFLPRLTEPVLQDYAAAVPEARDPEVLQVYTSFVQQYRSGMQPHIPALFGAVFSCTLDMINADFESCPDIRLQFYRLLEAVATHCFDALLNLGGKEFEVVMQSVFWGVEHLSNIQEVALGTLLELTNRFAKQPKVAQDYFKAYLVPSLGTVLKVFTDTYHRTSLNSHAQLLMRIVDLLETEQVAVPLWDPAAGNFPSNSEFVKGFIADMLATSFKNLLPVQIQAFVAGLFQLYTDQASFKRHLRDFTIQLKEFASEGDVYRELDEQEAKQKEAEFRETVPGLRYVAPDVVARVVDDDYEVAEVTEVAEDV